MAEKFNRKDFKKDVMQYMKVFSEAYTREAKRQLVLQAEFCMRTFYKDYTPKYYDRTYQLRDKSIIPYFHNNGKGYTGGVRVSSQNMQPYFEWGHETDPAIVVRLGWDGYHGDPNGINGRFVPHVTNPSPLSMLTDFYNSQTFRNSIYEYANKMALKQDYKYLTDFM